MAYFDAFSGASGDMILGALVDAGLDLAALELALATLGLDGYRLEARKETRLGIAATRLEVHLEAGHDHAHRHLSHIRRIIEGATLPGAAAAKALAVFTRLAEAEAHVHGTTPEKIHFHEVGAVDAIVDIVGAAVALELMGIERVVSSPLPTGGGTVQCAHGLMPVPAPATAELLKGVPLRPSVEQKELTTPTGAALLTTLAAKFGGVPQMSIEAIGYGAGKRQGETVANVLRVLVGRAAGDGLAGDTVWVIETNLDDTTGEVVADAGHRLMEAGALDVFTTPIMMKKGRPGLLLRCLVHEEARAEVERLIFEHTGTFGLRRSQWTRSMLGRRHETVETPFGAVRVKLGLRGDEVLRVAPEYEDCRRAAEAHGVSVQQVMQEAIRRYGGRTP
ncbi:MAG: nickel pincer cofactor biosynthesis protein LarC [Planctomycetes bacterium]|nr:nickel pincer cofactor biosynthesis protein LarC [Planctomycetota bacterium]